MIFCDHWSHSPGLVYHASMTEMTGNPPETLRSRRLILNAIRAADREELIALNGDPEVRRYLGGPVAAEQTRSALRNLLKSRDRRFHWAIRQTVDGPLLGTVDLSPHHDGEDWEISYLLQREYWGQGLAREAVTLVLQHGFRDLGFDSLLAETQAANRLSCRLLETLGFQKERERTRFSALQAIYRITASGLRGNLDSGLHMGT